MRGRMFLPILAALLLAVGWVVAWLAAPAHAAAVRIMPLGDSITGSPGCWRALLWNRLQDAGYTDIDFVGTLGPQGCPVPYDGDNEGHGGALVTNVAQQNLLPGWLAATDPDVVVMHFGTNDVWSDRPVDAILDAYSTLVAQMRASNPAMKILVAQIIPMNPGTCPECAQRVVALNAAIPGWAESESTAQSPIIVVDQWTGFSTDTDTYDGVHPNDSGDRKIADRWFPALAAVLDGTTSTPSATPTVTPTVTPTGSPPGGCSASYRVTGSWQGGFQGEVTVANTGDLPINGWSVHWTYTGDERISQAWSAEVTQNGTAVTAVNAAWNGGLAPGASTSFGFLASGSPASAPSPACAAD